MKTTRHQNTLDALLPSEMAERAERIGVEKTRLVPFSLLALAVLAGAFVAYGAMFSTIVMAGADGALPYGVIRLLAGLTFSLGLILVIVGGAELFTGNNLMVMAYASGKVSASEIIRAWALVYAGNLVGAVGVAFLYYTAGGYTHGSGAIGLTALTVGQGKVSLPAYQEFIHGILANILVCLAVWLCYGARTVTDKILVIIPPISAFVAAGFEHSVANMYLLSFAIFIKSGAPDEFWVTTGKVAQAYPNLTPVDALANLAMVTIGNMLGGVLVGVTYWFIYLRRRGTR